jgi:choline dehydrogenase-like flavoprotein
MPRKFDAIVIGTGFGGAVTACRLAQAGVRTLVLERGRRYDLASLPDLPRAGQIFPDPRRWMWSGSQGLWDLRDLDGVAVAQSAAYGGGSLIYANVHLRPPRDVFNGGWPDDCTGRDGLDRFYDLAGYMLEIAPVPEPWRGIGKVRVMADAFRDTARGVGSGARHPDPPRECPEDRNVFFPPLAITFPRSPQASEPTVPPPPLERELPLNRHRRPHGECQRCGECDTGCRYGAKNTLDRNYLAVAEDSVDEEGEKIVTIRTLCEALTVSRSGDGYEVVFLDHLLGSRRRESADHVFLCGGSINTTELLLRSFRQYAGPPEHGEYDATLGQGLQPVDGVGANYFINSDSLALIINADRETFPSAGPVITTALVYESEPPHRRRSLRGGGRSWFLIEDGGYPLPIEPLTAAFKTPLLLGRNAFDMEAFRQLTTIGSKGHEPVPDRYVSLLDGLHAAFRAGQFPDVIPGDVRKAFDDLHHLAQPLRDDEIGDLTEDVRDAVLLNSRPFRILKCFHIDQFLPSLWNCSYRFSLWLMHISRSELLRSTLNATHHRYGVDRLRRFPDRLVHALLGEPYPVNRPRTAFRDPPPPFEPKPQAVLLAMGRDDVPASLELGLSGRLFATFPDGGFPTLSEEERVMRGIADQLGGTLRSSPLWALARRPVTAHSHGGCALGTVTNEWGEVRGHKNLFINDGSLLPRPVGVNPSSTIAAVAERNIEHFVMTLNDSLPKTWRDDIENARQWRKDQKNVSLEPPNPVQPITLQHPGVGFAFAEEMKGRIVRLDAEEPSELPRPGHHRIPLAPFLNAEGRGEHHPPRVAGFRLDARVGDIGAFLNDEHHRVPLTGVLSLPEDVITTGPIEVKIRSGSMALLVAAARDRRLMIYHLPFEIDGQHWTLIGQKEIQDDPGFDAWLDAATLYVELCRDTVDLEELLDPSSMIPLPTVAARGILRLGLHDFAVNQLRHLSVLGAADPARVIWTLGSFGVFFFGQMQGAYAPEIEHFLSLFGRAFWRSAGDVHASGRGIRGLRGL